MAHGVTLYGWTAKRSGPAISIKGKDADGREHKVMATTIEAKGGRISARQELGVMTIQHWLIP